MTTLIRIILRCSTVCAIVGAALTACSKDRDHHDHPDLTTGEQLFNYHCAECHGEDGTGKLVDRTPANILTTKNLQGIVDYMVNVYLVRFSVFLK